MLDISDQGPRGVLVSNQNTQVTSNWRVGQILDAVVQSTEREGTARLIVGGRTLEVSTQPGLVQGQTLRLQVETLRPEPRLRILPQVDEAARLRQEAMRQLLPRQAPISGLLANVSALRRDTNGLQPLPPPVQRAVSQLWSALPDRDQLSQPDGLRRAVETSGLLFETRLAAAAQGLLPAGAISADTKGQLANLLNTVFRALNARPGGGTAPTAPPPSAGTPPPPVNPTLQPGTPVADVLSELFRQSESALSRIQTGQLTALANEGGFPWTFELPVRLGAQADVLQMTVDRDAETADPQERHWTVRLAFHFEAWGPVHCTIGLQGGSISTSWWAEHAATAGLLDRHLGELRQRLDDLGFHVGGMRCVHGSPPAARRKPDGGGLIDEQA